jgi:hypothetical protein
MKHRPSRIIESKSPEWFIVKFALPLNLRNDDIT